ncbi:MAG: hypothetical protein AB7P23_10095 [Amphiplicatus sp.]
MSEDFCAALRRWHFYAGMLVIPVFLLLAATRRTLSPRNRQTP